jgi:hypothetical protein
MSREAELMTASIALLRLRTYFNEMEDLELKVVTQLVAAGQNSKAHYHRGLAEGYRRASQRIKTAMNGSEPLLPKE